MNDVCHGRIGLDYRENGAHGARHLTVRSGEIAHIWGPSGSGKSTLLARLWGSRRLGDASLFIDLDGETLNFGALHPAHLAFVRAQLMHYLGQQPKVLPRERLKDWFVDKFNQERGAELAAGLARLDVSPKLLSRYACEVSGGELQRLMLLRAFFSSAPILILDEPCTGLDAKRRACVMHLLHGAARNAQKLVIYSSHSADERADHSLALV